jgi:hypothetical protein
MYSLEGVTARAGTVCSLDVFEVLLDENGAEQEAVVAAKLDDAHHHSSAPVRAFGTVRSKQHDHGLLLTLRPTANPRLWEAKDAATGTVLKLSLPEGAVSITNAAAFSYVWPHGDHFHRETCKSLKAVSHGHDHGHHHHD